MNRKRRIGEIIKLRTGDESYSAYVPRPLPPVPPLALAPLYPLLDKANLALGRLDGMSATIYAYAAYLELLNKGAEPVDP